MKLLNELSVKELKNLYINNKDFSDAVYSEAYDQAMEAQGEEFKLLGADVFEYHNHYSSFYLSTPNKYYKDGAAIAGKLNVEYMNIENEALYEKLNKLADRWENLTTDEQDAPEGDQLWDEINATADELAEGLTRQLRAFEDIQDDQIEEVLEQITEGYCYMGEWETDGEAVYEHITKVLE